MAIKKKVASKASRIRKASGDPEWWGTGGKPGSRGGSRPIGVGSNGGVGSFFGEKILDPAWTKPAPRPRIDPTTGKPLFPSTGGGSRPNVDGVGRGGGVRIGGRKAFGER
jgi:hypothetical protein